MSIKEMDEAYSNLKTEYFDIQDRLTTARQLVDSYEVDTFKLKKQLKIAVECMREYIRGGCYPLMEKKLKEIEELDKCLK